ncbi:MAG: sulfur relay protein DsrC [Acidiferrobacterales bacterium]
MLNLSEIMMEHHELETFEALIETVKNKAGQDMFFRIDIKPTYPDTPANWEDQLEGAFSGVNSITR